VSSVIAPQGTDDDARPHAFPEGCNMYISVKSGSTPVGGPVKSGRSWMKEESRGLDKRLVRPELVTAWIQRLRITSIDPLRRFWSRGEDRDRDGDRQEQE